MRTVVLVPRKEDHGRRDQIWDWVHHWMQTNHPTWEVFTGYDDSGGDAYSLSRARNNAARNAGDWDVAVVLDADTIAPPDVLEAAVHRASRSMNLVMAGDARMCMDKTSSDRILNGGPWFPRPDGLLAKTGTGANDSIYGEPSSGVLAVSRRLWDATGGYVEFMKGWGYEDLVFLAQANTYGDGIIWQPNGILLHFWHERSRQTDDTEDNFLIWSAVTALARNINGKELVTSYLSSLGHTWPG